MTLPFMTHWADGTPNYFVGKIWSGILRKENSTPRKKLTEKLYEQYYHTCYGQCLSNRRKEHPNDFFGEFGFEIDYATDLQPKIHTLREDKKNRWKAGMKIHPVIHNRTSNRLQFTPILECESIQEVKINYKKCFYLQIIVDGKELIGTDAKFSFIKNDGFESFKQFCEFFFNDSKMTCEDKETFTGQIIHWTDLKY